MSGGGERRTPVEPPPEDVQATGPPSGDPHGPGAATDPTGPDGEGAGVGGASEAAAADLPPAPDRVAGGGPDRGAEGGRFLKDAGLLYGAIYLGVVARFIGGFLVAKFLGPALYGLRTIFGLVEQYESFLTLGTYNAMEREVPYHRGRDEEDRAREISRNVLTANLLYAAGAALLLLAASFPLRASALDPIYADFLLFLAAYIVIHRLERFYHIDLVIRKRTRAVGGLRVIEASMVAVATASLTYFFGLRGLFIGIVIGKGTGLAYAAARSGWFPGFGASGPLLRRLVAIGFPIMLVKFLFVLFQTVDKVLIASFLPTEMLGYFGLAAILAAVVFATLADAVKVMFSPRLMEKLGRTGRRESVKNYLTEPTMLIAWLTPLAIGSLYLLVHLPFKYALTEYLPAIPVARILLLGQYFFAVVTMSILTCIALNRQVSVVWWTVGGTLVNALLNTMLLQAGWGITGVAVGTAVSYLLYTLAVSLYALRLFGGTDRMEPVRMAAAILGPWAIMVGLLLLLDTVLPVEELGFAADVAVSAFKVGAFLLLFGIAILPFRNHPGFVRLRESLSGLLRLRPT